MCLQKVKRFELVELPIKASTTGRVIFPSVPQLRNQANQMIVISGIEIFTVDSYLNSQVTNNIAGMPLAEVAKAVLVLYVNGEESIKMIPLARMINIEGTAGAPFRFMPFAFDELTNVDFDKSYVQFSSVTDANPYVIPFGISYIRLVKNPMLPDGQLTQG